LTGAADTTVEQMTADWIRFTANAETLSTLGLDPDATLSSQNRIVMFVYLHPHHPPVRAIGRISWHEPTSDDDTKAPSVVAEFQEIAKEDRKRIEDYLKEQALLDTSPQERRQQVRRKSDLFFREISVMLHILANMSEGKVEEFGEQFANLVGVKNTLGRRIDDKKLGDDICFSVERLASNLADLVGSRGGLRKVRIRKVTGKYAGVVEKDKILLGWEEAPPQEGKSYCLYIVGGGIFRSAKVTQALQDHFRTRNSIYEIQQIDL
jgi:hypothetical protein